MKTTGVNVQIKKIREVSFNINHNLINKLKGKLDLEIKFALGIKKLDDNILAILFTVGIMNDKNDLVEHTAEHHYYIENINEVFTFFENNQITDKANIFPSILGITYNTHRGMLVAKVAGTILEDYPLPILDVTNISNHFIRK